MSTKQTIEKLPTMVMVARYIHKITKVSRVKPEGCEGIWTVTLECGHTFHRTGARTRLGGLAYCADCRKAADQVITSQHFYIVEPGQPEKFWPATGRCECGREFDSKWPGDSGAEVCQTCWERQSSAAWWRTHGGLYRDPGPGGKHGS